MADSNHPHLHRCANLAMPLQRNMHLHKVLEKGARCLLIAEKKIHSLIQSFPYFFSIFLKNGLPIVIHVAQK